MKKTQIEKIYKENAVPANIIRHMQKVSEVAELLIKKFKEAGVSLNEELIITACLVHDVMRLKEDNKSVNHALLMGAYLSRTGEDELAALVTKHHFEHIDDLENWEEKIVYYSDKRVAHDRIVSLKERFTEIGERIAYRNPELEKKVFELEQEIKNVIGPLPV
ncbi:HD domain-containing protein [Candidatus Peregrinibacteria bacterium]|nr:HD domain-containing protein [Candidatus Peregrinibacteria bacterium]